MDGGSSTEVLAYLHTLKKPFFYQSKKDKGIYDAMNNGVDLATGDWLYFLGAGDFFYNDKILETINNITIEKNTSLIAGRIIYEGENKPFVYSKSKMVKNVHMSKRMWISNGLHHQGTFYKKELFKKRRYNLNYKILSDYHFNLQLLKGRIKYEVLDTTIAKCNSDGVSKMGDWSIYQEEINLKTNLSSIFFRPFFYIIAFTKFLSRKIVNG